MNKIVKLFVCLIVVGLAQGLKCDSFGMESPDEIAGESKGNSKSKKRVKVAKPPVQEVEVTQDSAGSDGEKDLENAEREVGPLEK